MIEIFPVWNLSIFIWNFCIYFLLFCSSVAACEWVMFWPQFKELVACWNVEHRPNSEENKYKRNLIMLFIMLFKLLFVAYFREIFCLLAFIFESFCLKFFWRCFLCKSGAIFLFRSEKRLLSVALLSTYNEHWASLMLRLKGSANIFPKTEQKIIQQIKILYED